MEREKLMLDCLTDAFIDSLKILPFLFLTYLAMEYLERKTEEGSARIVRKAGRFGPLFGGLLGIVPQCGFSTAGANLYAGRVISVGTMMAVFLSTSDEMLPILISTATPVSVIVRIVSVKAVLAVLAGFAIDAVCRAKHIKHTGQPGDEEDLDIERLCEKEECGCEEGGIFSSALKHTVHIILFIFAITLVLNLAFEFIGEDRLAMLIRDRAVLGEMIAALIGLIPNCGASVLLTQLYLNGVMNAGQLIAGLLTGAGVGLLVLFRVNPDTKENLRIAGLLYACGVAGGLLVHAVTMLI